MYATIRRYPGNRELAENLAARGEEVMAILQGVDGFRAYFLIRTDDGAASVTVCDDRSGAEETNQVAASWLKENMPGAAANPPEITAGEVVLSA